MSDEFDRRLAWLQENIKPITKEDLLRLANRDVMTAAWTAELPPIVKTSEEVGE